MLNLRKILITATLLAAIAFTSNSAKAQPSFEDTILYLNSYLLVDSHTLDYATDLKVVFKGSETFTFDFNEINPNFTTGTLSIFLKCTRGTCIKRTAPKEPVPALEIVFKTDKFKSAQKAFDHIFSNIVKAEKKPDPFK